MVRPTALMQPLGRAVHGALAEVFQAAPLSAGKVECAWKAAVGPAVGRATAVRLEGTTLLVDATSAQWAQEVRRSSSLILARLQAFLGTGEVQSIEVRRVS